MKTYTYINVEKLAAKMKKDYPGLRRGQALMNALYEFDPELYKKLSDTPADCFYLDSKIEGPEGFIAKVYEAINGK
jgi:hypothetical protein